MELSETLRTRGCELHLEWIPRERNQLADDLTNQDFKHFSLDSRDSRVQFVGGDTRWLVLDGLMAKAQEFHMELAEERKRKVTDPKPVKNKKRKKLDPW